MAGESYLNQLVVDTAKEFFKRSNGDVVSPYVLKMNFKQEGILKHLDRGLVPHVEHDDYESDVFFAQKE